MATPTLIAIIVSCIVFALFVGLLLMFCRCKRNQSKKSAAAKDYEMDSVRPSIVAAQQSQAPPPYYPASGLDNKALEHSMDLALSMEEQKSALYATQNGYSYHPSTGVVGGGIGIPGHTIPGNECKYIYVFTHIFWYFFITTIKRKYCRVYLVYYIFCTCNIPNRFSFVCPSIY